MGQRIELPNGIILKVVDSEPCPMCGTTHYNRPKVCGHDNLWWWRCYNKECSVDYYQPETGGIEYEQLS